MSVRPQHPPTTSLDVVASWVPGAQVEGTAEITGLTLSSQRVQPGDLYVALPGTRAHGIAYAAEAVSAGAVAVLTDRAGAAAAGRPPGVPLVVVEQPRVVLGRLSAHVYGDPATSMRMIGVTGTQGKTTTTRLAEIGFTAAGVRAAVIGTVGTRIAGHDVKTALTTPEAPDLHGLFAVMREARVEVCAMEVSSHALAMGRVDGVEFDVAVFLNLGRDHLDFHGDMEAYFLAKASLFTAERARRGLVNVDDEHGRRLAAQASIPVVTFTSTGRDADWTVTDVVTEPHGSSFVVHGPNGLVVAASVPLPGAFNVSNAVAAIAAAFEAGMDAEGQVAQGIARGAVPGRFETVSEGRGFEVVVDYAHKPDAVRAALEALRPLTVGRVIVVLGAGGDRDRGKRPLMGRIAGELADVVVVTDDNPRTEEPAAIRAAVLAGARAGAAEVHEVGDRHQAIARAIAMASNGDTVLIAGKGHEAGQEIDGVVHPFDDREVARAVLERRDAR